MNVDVSCKLPQKGHVNILGHLRWLIPRSFLHGWWFCDGAGYTCVDLLDFGVIPFLEAEEARIFFEPRGIAVCSVRLGTSTAFKRFCNI